MANNHLAFMRNSRKSVLIRRAILIIEHLFCGLVSKTITIKKIQLFNMHVLITKGKITISALKTFDYMIQILFLKMILIHDVMYM